MFHKKFAIFMLAGALLFSQASLFASPVYAAESVKEEGKDKESETIKEKAGLPTIVLLTGEGQKTPEYIGGENKKLLVHVKNTGTATAKDVRVSPVIGAMTEEWPFEIPNINNDQSLGDIEPGQMKDISYDVTAREDVQNRYYKTNFQISYNDGENLSEVEKYVFVKMKQKETEKDEEKNDENEMVPEEGGFSQDFSSYGDGGSSTTEEKSSVPRVIVTGFSTNPGQVKAGSNFTLNVTVKNTSKTTAVSNMVFTFAATTEGKDENTTAAAFLPVSGANSIYKESIKANSEATISIDLNAKSDLVQKPYSIDMAMKYEDKNAAQFESSASISIPIRQEPRFEFSEIQVNPESIEIGAESNISCNLYNLGKIKLYNIKAKVEGQGIESKEVFIGNVDSGATAAIDLMVTGSQAGNGPAKMNLVCSYEDADGNVSTIKKEFQAEVIEPVAMDDYSKDMMMEQEKPKSFPVKYIALAVLAIVVAIVAIIVIKKKKAKRENDIF
ncbi:MAG TPA: hypothetical protein VIR32_04705 [Lachnospiraceae bacterium]